MTSAPDPRRGAAAEAIRRYAPMIYGPTALYSVGQGAILPLLPIIARELGADLATAALVTAMLVVGQLVGNLPAGWLVSRIGERHTMTLAAAVSLIGIAGMLLSGHLGVLMLSVLLIGVCASAFALARHTFMTTRVPLAYRARSLSLLGGSFRLGAFTGPFVAAGLLGIFENEEASIWFFGACLVVVGLLVTFGPDPEQAADRAARAAETRPTEEEDPEALEAEDTGEAVTGSIPTAERIGVFRTMARHRRVLSRLGLAAASLSAVRASRPAVLPLWGVSIGLDSSTIALVVGISGALDFALFYASGQVMDRFGRLWAAVPALILMGGALFALSFTHELDAATMWFGVFATVIGVGNGLSSGILLTLGSDIAPKTDPAPFLGAWRTITDAGGALSPLLVSGLTAVASISVAAGGIGAIGLLGALAFIRWVPRFVPTPGRD
ncbi:MFS transporter [Microbacterium sp. MEC084]|uniref:MFS transporter n=1 Tax=Microbacterium sp. MEC084 TaxID=1963027 RepID=UPI001104D061|nr:MFS transporter [Microbacterium sp. MEC084]